MNPGILQVFLSPPTSRVHLLALKFMETLDELLPGFDPITSDRLSAPVLQSTRLLGQDIWQQAIDQFDIFAGSEARVGFSLEERQYQSDRRMDYYLYDTLVHEFELLDAWWQKNFEHPEAAAVATFLQRRPHLGPRSWIDRQEKIYLWAQTNAQELIASSILGWRLLSEQLAASLHAWSWEYPDDSRSQQIHLWQDSLGFHPQNRLRIWAIRFLEDARAPQIIQWETDITRQLQESHPELLAETL